jgi:outer membrane protein assembly factor BamB
MKDWSMKGFSTKGLAREIDTAHGLSGFPSTSFGATDRFWRPGMRALAVLLWASLMAGCAAFSWIPGIGEDDEKEVTKPAQLVDFDAEVRIDRQWKSKVGKGLGKKYIRLQPLVTADRVIAADAYGVVVAFDRFSGKEIWRQQADQVERRSVGVARILDRSDGGFVSGGVGGGEGLVLLGTTRGDVIALSVTDGSVQWRSYLGSEIGARPTAAQGRVFAQTIDGELIALDAKTGDQIWSYSSQVPLLTLRGTSAPVTARDVVYTGFASGKVVALRASNGEPIWDQRIMLPEGRSELDRIVDVDASPLVANGSVFGQAYQGRLTQLGARDGRPRWEVEISSFLDLAEGYGQVYTVGDKDSVTAVDQSRGEIVWQHELLARRGLTAPLAYSNYLVVGDAEGYLHVMAQRDGRFMGRTRVSRKGLRTAFTLADGTFFVLDNAGSLHAYKITTR